MKLTLQNKITRNTVILLFVLGFCSVLAGCFLISEHQDIESVDLVPVPVPVPADSIPIYYEFNRPVYESDTFLDITEINMDKLFFEGKQAALEMEFMPTDEEMILYLMSSSLPAKVEEIGIIDINTSDYQILLVPAKSEECRVVAANGDYMIYNLTKDHWQTYDLMLLDRKTGIPQYIDSFSEDYLENVFNNKVLLLDDLVYYDNIREYNHGFTRDLFSFNAKTKEKKLVLADAQNPLMLNGLVAAVIKSENERFDLLADLEGSPFLTLDRSMDIAAATHVYAIINKPTEEEKLVTVFALYNLTDDQELFSSFSNVGNLHVSENFVTWSIWRDIRPYLYLISKDCFVRISELPGKTQYYWAPGREVGVIMQSFRDLERAPRYYKFELKN
ncbi:MAG: hypothetical protein LBK56_01555 [Gracilibacteraceae bacterium]|jgi:hypothetical protein|nr:hypothetical protein [Gracilibacteraceae bacterium]